MGATATRVMGLKVGLFSVFLSVFTMMPFSRYFVCPKLAKYTLFERKVSS